MTKLTRVLLGALIATPVVAATAGVATAGVATADEYRTGALRIGLDGISSTGTVSGVSGDGQAYYKSHAITAGPGGVDVDTTSSAAGGHHVLPVRLD